MEYTYTDLSGSDPFRCLDTDLDDVSDVIRDMNAYPMDTSGPSFSDGSVVSHSASYHGESLSPSYYYRSPPSKSEEISAIVSLLNDDKPDRMRVHDPYVTDSSSYSTIKFSPPDFQTSNSGSTATLLPQLRGDVKPTVVRPTMSLYQPDTDLQHLLSPGDHVLIQQPQPMYRPEALAPVPTVQSNATKEQLLKLLVSLSPHEVERLREDVEAVQGTPTSVIASTSRYPAVSAPSRAEKMKAPRPSGVATRVMKREPASEWDNDSDMDDDEGRDDEMPRRGPRTERRTAHNLIEKKYRCSINDRIQLLKTMLAGDGKLSKSATLRRAIEYIEQLEAKNSELSANVLQLRQLLHTHSIEIPPFLRIDVSPPNPAGSAASPTGSTSPPASTSSYSAQVSPVMSPTPSKQQFKRSRMVDQARVSLCAIMFALLIFNPLSALSRPSESSERTPGRTLQSVDDLDLGYAYDDNWWQNNVIRPCLIWFINIFIVICVLTRLLVYGEPVQDFKSRTWSAFLSTKKAAAAAFEAGNQKEAQRQLVECLQILERPLPSSPFDEAMAVVWQVIRHVLNSMWIGRWLSRRKRDSRKPVTVVCKSHAHTAIIFHQLNQLDLLGVGDHPPSALWGLHLALSSVNLAESAGASIDGLPYSTLAHIYVAAAIRCRVSLPVFLSSALCSYFLRRARRHIRRAPSQSVSSLLFLFHPLAKKYLSDSDRLHKVLGQVDPYTFPFSSCSSNGLVVDRLRLAFKPHLLGLLLDSLRSLSNSSSSLDIADTSQLLLSICTATNGNSDTEVVGDSACTWWTHVLTCGLLWRQGRATQARSHYPIVRQCPKELLDNPLALSVGHAFCARKLYLDDKANGKFCQLVRMHSAKALAALRMPGARVAPQGFEHIQEGMRLLAFEWTMCSLLAAWRSALDEAKPYWTQTPPKDIQMLYQEAYNHFHYSVTMKKEKNELNNLELNAFSLTSRMLNGANAVQTWSELIRLKSILTQQLYAQHPSERNQDITSLTYHMHVLTKYHAGLAA